MRDEIPVYKNTEHEICSKCHNPIVNIGIEIRHADWCDFFKFRYESRSNGWIELGFINNTEALQTIDLLNELDVPYEAFKWKYFTIYGVTVFTKDDSIVTALEKWRLMPTHDELDFSEYIKFSFEMDKNNGL